MVEEKITSLLKNALREEGVDDALIVLEFPSDPAHGDYSSNAALFYAKQLNTNPRDLANKLSDYFAEHKPDEVVKAEVAGPGFINFFLSSESFSKKVDEVLKKKETFGTNDGHANEKIILEYTTQNVLKEFHIGHLMSNTIGESLSRLFAAAGAEVKRDSYQGDVGLHIAQAVWGMQKLGDEMPAEGDPIDVRMEYLGRAYSFGATSYKDNEAVQTEIKQLNKKLYEQSDEQVVNLYTVARRWSLESFESIYERLGTQLDFQFFESQTAEPGIEIVRGGLKKGIFKQSDGAVIFPGEEYGLHTRVFINSEGLPTYEAKDIGLMQIKHDMYPFDKAFIFTANEQNEYFKVVLKAGELVLPEIAPKISHIGHGMMKLSSGKMSSRTGDIVRAESLIDQVRDAALEKMRDQELSESIALDTAEKIAVAAIKYSILKQATGKDIVFDISQALSLEGDSGPYLQYTYVRAQSILEKARGLGLDGKVEFDPDREVTAVERILWRFPDIVQKAQTEQAPHHVAHYLTSLASEFNSFYASTRIVDKENPLASHLLAVTEAVGIVLRNGLYLLGADVVEHM